MTSYLGYVRFYQDQPPASVACLVLEVLVFDLIGVLLVLRLLRVDVLRHLPHLQDVVLRHRRADPVVVHVPAEKWGGVRDGKGSKEGKLTRLLAKTKMEGGGRTHMLHAFAVRRLSGGGDC